MNRIYGAFYMLVIWWLCACNKDDVKPALAAGSVSILGLTVKDTLMRDIAIVKDTAVIMNLQAVLSGEPSSDDHIVTFRADTSRMNAYRVKYGNATALPYGNYVFFRNQCRIRAGASISDSIQLNLLYQTKLKPETVYVLPVVIQRVDDGTNAVVPGEVLYIVIKTGKSPGLDKSNWRITASSVNSAANAPEFAIDNDNNSAWASAYGPMPQNLVIDFGSQITFNGVSYFVPATYFTYGGYPTKIKIEVSTNGTTWTDKGTYNGATTAILWKQDIGSTTARYLRFTVLQAAPYLLGLEVVLIAELSIVI